MKWCVICPLGEGEATFGPYEGHVYLDPKSGVIVCARGVPAADHILVDPWRIREVRAVRAAGRLPLDLREVGFSTPLEPIAGSSSRP